MMEKSIIVNPLLDDEQNMLTALKKVLNDNIFSVVEIWDTLDENVLSFIKSKTNELTFDVSLSPLMTKQGYSLAIGSDESIYYIKKRMSLLADLGIKNISISSPLISPQIGRSDQICILIDEFHKICSFAKECGVILGFELFDVAEDKKRVLGMSNEVESLFNSVDYDNLFLIWDLGHVCLNHENYIDSLKKLGRFIKRVHISNYSLIHNPLYFGDKHLPFDVVGEIKRKDIVAVIDCLKCVCENISYAFEVSVNTNFDFLSSFEKTYKYICMLGKSDWSKC